MTDLSKPALLLLPKQAAAHTPNVWPVPPFAAYAPAQALSGPKDCEVEGPNGKVTRGRLVANDWQAGVAQVQVPPARGNLPLRFAQFRRLTLVTPLAPLAPALGDPAAALVAHHPAVELTVRYKCRTSTSKPSPAATSCACAFARTACSSPTWSCRTPIATR